MTTPGQVPSLVGWPLLPVPDGNGQLHYPTYEESVRQLIRIILSTRPGEQLQRREFGAGLDNFLHQPNNLTTRRRIRDVIVESLDRWERRIILDRVEVGAVADQPSKVHIEIAYRLRRTGLMQRMGVTIELES
jgi:uncharacterized protein